MGRVGVGVGVLSGAWTWERYAVALSGSAILAGFRFWHSSMHGCVLLAVVGEGFGCLTTVLRGLGLVKHNAHPTAFGLVT